MTVDEFASTHEGWDCKDLINFAELFRLVFRLNICICLHQYISLSHKMFHEVNIIQMNSIHAIFTEREPS